MNTKECVAKECVAKECIATAGRGPKPDQSTPSILSIEALLDPRLDLVAALVLVRRAAGKQPSLDALLVRDMLAGCKGDIRELEPESTIRLLTLVEGVSQSARAASSLAPLLRHPSEQIRSKLALMMGRHTQNLNRARSFLACKDDRVRANAIESLWRRRDAESVALFRQCAADPNNRVRVNAALGLYWAEESDARSLLSELSAAADPALRAGAAWSMGQTEDPAFAEVLTTLCGDPDAKVQQIAARSRANLRNSAR